MRNASQLSSEWIERLTVEQHRRGGFQAAFFSSQDLTRCYTPRKLCTLKVSHFVLPTLCCLEQPSAPPHRLRRRRSRLASGSSFFVGSFERRQQQLHFSFFSSRLIYDLGAVGGGSASAPEPTPAHQLSVAEAAGVGKPKVMESAFRRVTFSPKQSGYFFVRMSWQSVYTLRHERTHSKLEPLLFGPVLGSLF